MKPYSILERFEDKYIPEPNSGCWLWIGAVNKKTDYGQFAMKRMPEDTRMESTPAHRASWMIFRGPIPSGLEVCHSCDIPSCVNPGHLWLGTHAQNMADCAHKKRIVCNPLRGSQAANAKLTDEQVREIKTKQLSRCAYATKFNVAPTYINNIQSGRVWSHIIVDPATVKPPRVQTREQARKAAYLREWKKRCTRAVAA